jgi:hypothetical protein
MYYYFNTYILNKNIFMFTIDIHYRLFDNVYKIRDNRISSKVMNGSGSILVQLQRAGGWCEPVRMIESVAHEPPD